MEYEHSRHLFFLRFFITWALTISTALKKAIWGNALSTNSFWFDGLSKECRMVKNSAFSWRALELVYNLTPTTSVTLADKITKFWNGLHNAQAVRNRFRIVKSLLKEHMERFLRNDIEIRLFSIASGSARAVLEAISDIRNDGYKLNKIHIVLLDLDSTALEYSKTVLSELRLSDLDIRYVNKSVHELEKVVHDFHPNIVEMVGFLEYRPYQKAVDLVQRIHRVMTSGGIFLTSQITPNWERWFLMVVMNWPMIYRTKKDFLQILQSGGFFPGTTKLIEEPFGIHIVSVCRKDSA